MYGEDEGDCYFCMGWDWDCILICMIALWHGVCAFRTSPGAGVGIIWLGPCTNTFLLIGMNRYYGLFYGLGYALV